MLLTKRSICELPETESRKKPRSKAGPKPGRFYLRSRYRPKRGITRQTEIIEKRILDVAVHSPGSNDQLQKEPIKYNQIWPINRTAIYFIAIYRPKRPAKNPSSFFSINGASTSRNSCEFSILRKYSLTNSLSENAAIFPRMNKSRCFTSCAN